VSTPGSQHLCLCDEGPFGLRPLPDADAGQDGRPRYLVACLRCGGAPESINEWRRRADHARRAQREELRGYRLEAVERLPGLELWLYEPREDRS
jgi:hypothetical protein